MGLSRVKRRAVSTLIRASNKWELTGQEPRAIKPA